MPREGSRLTGLWEEAQESSPRCQSRPHTEDQSGRRKWGVNSKKGPRHNIWELCESCEAFPSTPVNFAFPSAHSLPPDSPLPGVLQWRRSENSRHWLPPEFPSHRTSSLDLSSQRRLEDYSSANTLPDCVLLCNRPWLDSLNSGEHTQCHKERSQSASSVGQTLKRGQSWVLRSVSKLCLPWRHPPSGGRDFHLLVLPPAGLLPSTWACVPERILPGGWSSLFQVSYNLVAVSQLLSLSFSWYIDTIFFWVTCFYFDLKNI